MSTVVFVDAENIRLNAEDLLFLWFTYKVDVFRIYTTSSLANHYQNLCLPVHCRLMIMDVSRSSRALKNSIDIHLSIDVIQSVFSESLDRYIIASHDRDFLPLYHTLKSHGKRVVALGLYSLPDSVCKTVDEVILLSKNDVILISLLRAFLLRRRSYLSLSELKKNLKRLHARREIGSVFRDLIGTIRLSYPHVFDIDHHPLRNQWIIRLLDHHHP